MENIVSIHLSGISHNAIISQMRNAERVAHSLLETLSSIYFQNAISKVKFHNLETQCRLSEYHLGFMRSVPDQT